MVRRGFLIETDCVLSYLSQAVKLNIFHLILQTIALLSQHFQLSRHISVDKGSTFIMRKPSTSSFMMHVLVLHQKQLGASSDTQATFLVEAYTV